MFQGRLIWHIGRLRCAVGSALQPIYLTLFNLTPSAILQGGVFGSVADSAAVLAALDPGAKAEANGVADKANGVAERSEGRTVVLKAAAPYAYELPVGKAALIMIDFQRDFFLPGGFGDALGNDIGLLKVCICTSQCTAPRCPGEHCCCSCIEHA